MKSKLLLSVAFLVLLSTVGIAKDKGKSLEEIKAKIQEMRVLEKKRLQQLMPKVRPLLNYDIELLQAALQIKVLEKYQGAVLVSYDSLTEVRKYLGKIEDQFAAESIFNEYGPYGSEYSVDSIWNEYGSYGGQYSLGSPFNCYSANPPMIVKNKIIIGYLTVSKFIQGGVDPAWLKSFFVY